MGMDGGWAEGARPGQLCRNQLPCCDGAGMGR